MSSRRRAGVWGRSAERWGFRGKFYRPGGQVPLALCNKRGSTELQRPTCKMWLIKLSPLEAGEQTG